MLKTVFKIGWISAVVFCLVSFISAIPELVFRGGHPIYSSDFHVGYPYKYYRQFWMSSPDNLHWGTDPWNFILDVLITVGVVSIVFFVWRKIPPLRSK